MVGGPLCLHMPSLSSLDATYSWERHQTVGGPLCLHMPSLSSLDSTYAMPLTLGETSDGGKAAANIYFSHIIVCAKGARGEEDVFDRLGIKKTMQEKTYLATFLAAGLCKFMLPLENATVMRPGVFRIANKMAKGDVFCLAVPVLADIYRGLNETISSLDLATANVVFPAHYLFGGARHFDDWEGQTLFKSSKGVGLHHLATKLPQHERKVDDSPSPNVHNLEYLISIRSYYLTLRCEELLKEDVCDGTLSDIMNH
ncbi:hypothetical protein Vadar_002268 [Vaccinium darrowii]|uniref:Uncharacterized protein n=1 Tax=Vaccinium darrowii TaxID=229202 RepID=A0ACB7X6Y1_9ERIC|nr:hypothetical protein Vadar_002268 [Vaccinium darrowii]